MSALVKNGADPCARTEDGATPLHISAAKGDVEACRLLLHHGAGGKRRTSSSTTTTSSFRRDGEGKTALIVASIHGHAEVVRFLLSEAGAQIQDTDFRTAQDFERGKFSSAGGNALHHAAEHGRLAVMKVLLEHCERHGILEQMVDAPTQTGRSITPLCVFLINLALSVVASGPNLIVCCSATVWTA
jgi:ankyrin repeat protein